MNNLFNEYGRKARLFPALLCSLPFLLVKHFLIDYYFGTSLSNKLFAIIFEDISLIVVLMYLLTQINRFVSKKFFENKAKFPTTLMLLPSSKNLSDELRGEINKKVVEDFHISLPTIADEKSNIENATMRTREITSLIIHKVGDGALLLQHNIEYGFMRNLIGGSVISVVISLASIFIFQFVFKNSTAYVISVILSIVYLLPIVFSRMILKNYSEEYAHILFREYVGKNK